VSISQHKEVERMKRPKHAHDHLVAPKSWRHTPNMTGDYDLDASIMHGNNKSVPNKIATHTKQDSYGPKRYAGYDGYSGDD
jgi:hypothetical protein